MTLTEAREILIDHHRWRNGDGNVYPSYNVSEVNKALKTAIDALRLLDDVRTDSEKDHRCLGHFLVRIPLSVWEEVERLK